MAAVGQWVRRRLREEASTASARTGRLGGWAVAFRLGVVGVGIGGWFWTQSLIARRPFPSGIGDALHNLSAPLNGYLALHPTAANGLLIVSSGLVDLLALFVFAEWIFGWSVRPLLGLTLVLSLRQLMVALCALPAPDGMIWHYPGFPSLLVTYGVSNDFFFSAHLSITVYAATELARLRRPWLTRLAVVIVVFEAASVLVLRAHYTMDVFTAIVTALYCAHLAERLSPPLGRRWARYLAPPNVSDNSTAI